MRSPYFLYLILLIIPMIFLNLWMFENSIGMTGIEQKELPFKLNGILYYLVRIVTPILSLYFYSKTNKNFITLILLIFGIFSSLVSMSRFPFAVIISAICYFTYINKNYILLFLSSLSLGVSFTLSSLMRDFYQIASDYGTFIFLFNEFSIFDFITKINDLDRNILSTFFSGITNTLLRIESFKSIIQSSNYDLNNVIGVDGPNIILRLFSDNKKIDIDAHHLEWQGYIMPKGLYHGPSLFGDLIILTKENNWLIWFILFSFFFSFMDHNYGIFN